MCTENEHVNIAVAFAATAAAVSAAAGSITVQWLRPAIPWAPSK